MNRLEFMKQLARLLDDLPREEKIEILKYYNGYFDDAGVENEADIIAQLGSPEKVAAEVKAGMEDALEQEERLNQQAGEETAHQEARFTEAVETARRTEEQKIQEVPTVRHKKKNGVTTLIMVVLLILTFRIWFGILAGVFGFVMGLIGLLIGLVGGVIGCIVSGVLMLITEPLSGMFSLAVGIFLVGALLLVGMLVGLVFGRLFPFLVGMFRKVFSVIGEAVGGFVDGLAGRRDRR